MSSHTNQSSAGSFERSGSRWSRLRLGLLLLTAAVFLLVPAAQAFAETGHVEVKIVGTGSGEVRSEEEAEFGIERGTPPIECSYNGSTQSGQCENTPALFGGEPGFYAAWLEAFPAAGSEFVGWTVDKGEDIGECQPGSVSAPACLISNVFGEENVGVEWEITAEFKLEPVGPPSFKLNLSTSGTGSGSFECEVESSGTPEPCEEEYEEGTAVKVIPVPATGSEFVGFTTEHGGECTGATCEFTMDAEHTANAENNLETFGLTVNENGPGSLDVECNGSSCASLTEIPYGTSVTVTAEPDVGAEVTAFEGTGSAAGCEAEGSPCTFTIEEPSSVSAEFEFEEESLTIEEPGTGTGTVECNGGSCAGPWLYGETIEVTASPTGGSTLGPIGGTGSAALCSGSPCSFEIKQATTVSVTFNPPGAATLTVIKGGNGSGTIESTTGGIDCGLACSGSFASGETVTLKVTPASSGSIFLAWSGNCTPISATECEVEVKSGGTTVTASFAAVPVISTEPPGANCQYGGTKIEYAGTTEYVCNGLVGKGIVVGTATAGECPEGGITVEVEGEPSTKQAICNGHQGVDGEPGKGIVVGTATAGECPEGGITVEIEGEPSTKQAICNGDIGEPGERGEIGFPGPEGPEGPAGSQGSPGANGSNGAIGIQGPQGPQGPQGKPGATGKVKVTCKVEGSKKVVCKVKQSQSSKRRNLDLSWSLHRDGRILSHGTTTAVRLQRVLNHLRPGRYLLHIAGQPSVVIKVS